MTPAWVLVLNLTSIVASATAALVLYWGSLTIDWGQQTWDGESPAELRHQRKQKVFKRIGIPCVFLAAICQLALALFSPSN